MDAGRQQSALDRALRGDLEARGELLESLQPYVHFLVRVVHDSRLQARLGDSDLVQDAMLEIHRCFAGFKGTTVAELLAWLKPIVMRTAGHSLRAHRGTTKRDPARELGDLGGLNEQIADSGSSPSATAMREELTAQMAQALTRLPDDMQQVLLGRHADGLSHAVLAEKLHRSEAAVRVLYTRALRRLRMELQDLAPEK
jgi:RNA polymerase sigma-70 factor (ECF subfamily)